MEVFGRKMHNANEFVYPPTYIINKKTAKKKPGTLKYKTLIPPMVVSLSKIRVIKNLCDVIFYSYVS